jgi:Subtilisin inhibitor-like
MRPVAALSLAAIALAASASGSAGTAAGTSLTITFWAEGPDASQPRRWTLRCSPAGGSHPRAAVACRRLAAGGIALFAPVPPNAVCTEIYGGPQKARVVGKLAGKRIWASVSRTNGCHIARWDRLAPWLLPRGGVT